jgi:hypothetical protein
VIGLLHDEPALARDIVDNFVTRFATTVAGAQQKRVLGVLAGGKLAS